MVQSHWDTVDNLASPRFKITSIQANGRQFSNAWENVGGRTNMSVIETIKGAFTKFKSGDHHSGGGNSTTNLQLTRDRRAARRFIVSFSLSNRLLGQGSCFML